MPSVAMMPGATQLIWMPSGAHSIATVLESATTPARAAAVCATPGMPRVVTAAILTMRPPPPPTRAPPPPPRRLLHHVPSAAEVGVDDRVEAFRRKIDRRLRELAAGIVDQH